MKRIILEDYSGIIFLIMFGCVMLFFTIGILIVDDKQLPKDYNCGDKNILGYECGYIEKVIGFHGFNYLLAFHTGLLSLICFYGLINEWRDVHTNIEQNALLKK
jgi:hypothetical protein